MALLINKEGILLEDDSSVNEIYLRIKYIGDLPGKEIKCNYYSYLSKEKFNENYKKNKLHLDRIPYDQSFIYDPSADGLNILDFVHQKTIDLLTNPIYADVPKREAAEEFLGARELVKDPSTGEVVMESVLVKDAWLDESEISIIDLD